MKDQNLFVTHLHPAEYFYVLILGAIGTALVGSAVRLVTELAHWRLGPGVIGGGIAVAGLWMAYEMLRKASVRWSVWDGGLSRTEGFLPWARYERWFGFDAPLHVQARSGAFGYWLGYGTVFVTYPGASPSEHKADGFVRDAAGLAEVANAAAALFRARQRTRGVAGPRGAAV